MAAHDVIKRHVLLVWVSLLIFQVLIVAFLLMLASMYLTPWSPTSFLGFLVINALFTEQCRFVTAHHSTFGVAYAISSLPFITGITQMLRYSIKKGRLAFGAGGGGRPTTKVLQLGHHRLRGYWRRLIKRYLSVGNEQYTLVLVMFECVQIFIQTVQAYRNSKYLSDKLINQAYGLMIFINCLSTPLIHFYWEVRRRNLLVAQLTSVVVDALLDFVWGVILQGLLFVKYWHVLQDYDDRPWATDPEGTARELGQLLVTSIPNFVFSVFPFVTSAATLVKVRSLLARAKLHGRILPQQDYRAAVTSRARKQGTSQHRRVQLNRCLTLVMVLMMLHGVVVACVSIAAFWSHDPTSVSIACQNQLHPWFATSITCVGRTINCSRLNVRGKHDELREALRTINTFLLARLEIVDCPSLEVPSAIQQFSEISTLRIVNSIITAWNDDAALRAPYLSNLQTLMIWNSTFQCVPRGIFVHSLPMVFEWIDLRFVNANDWMPFVGDTWCSVVYFTCDNCQLREFPHAVHCMKGLQQLQLQNNLIADIPNDAVGRMDDIQYVALTNNPLTALPQCLWEVASLAFALEVQATSISSIPADFGTFVGPDFTLHAFGTPLCDSVSATSAWLVCRDDTSDWD